MFYNYPRFTSHTGFEASYFAENESGDITEANVYRESFNTWITRKAIPWSWYVTLTYANEAVSFEKADKDYLKWVRQLERVALSARKARRYGLRWIRVLEQHNHRRYQTAHIHAIIADCNSFEARDLLSLWPHGRINKANRYQVGYNTINYLSKHIYLGANLRVSDTLINH